MFWRSFSGADFALSGGAVAEFKGPTVFGVVRLAQVSREVAMIQAKLTGLPPGMRAWSINEFGDLTRGAATTGAVFNPINNHEKVVALSLSLPPPPLSLSLCWLNLMIEQALGDLGMLNFDEKRESSFSGTKEKLRVIDVIGRSIVVYGSQDMSSDQGVAAAVVAISGAGVDGQSCNKLCACDGSTIWEPLTNPHSLTKC